MKKNALKVIFIFFIPLIISSQNSTVKKNFKTDGDWNQLDAIGAPSARYGHSMVSLSDGRVLLIDGEDTNGFTDDMFYFDQTSWNAIVPEGNKPSKRKQPAVIQASNSKVYLFGGKGSDWLNDLFTYDPVENVFVQITASGSPPVRSNANLIEYDGKLYLSGGENGSGSLNDLWTYDLTSSAWIQKASANIPLSGRAMVRNGSEIYVIGAEPDKINFYSIQQNFWASFNSTGGPSPRRFAAFCQSALKAWIAGGIDDLGNYLKDTWEFDFTSFSWTRLADLHEGVSHAGMVPKGGGLILFGGRDNLGDFKCTTYGYNYAPVSIDNENVPVNFVLQQNYPNPFNPSTRISYSLPYESRVKIEIYNAIGQLIETIAD